MVQIEKEYGPKGLKILAFPCNQFKNQEPAKEKDIEHYLTSIYKFKFPIFQKIEVNGNNTHPVYQFLRFHSDLNNAIKEQVGEIPWNFAKFIVSGDGRFVLDYYKPNKYPMEIAQDIRSLNEGWGKDPHSKNDI